MPYIYIYYIFPFNTFLACTSLSLHLHPFLCSLFSLFQSYTDLQFNPQVLCAAHFSLAHLATSLPLPLQSLPPPPQNHKLNLKLHLQQAETTSGILIVALFSADGQTAAAQQQPQSEVQATTATTTTTATGEQQQQQQQQRNCDYIEKKNICSLGS